MDFKVDSGQPVVETIADTVGAVALDGAGNLAAATSTGGMSGKPAGGSATRRCLAAVSTPTTPPGHVQPPAGAKRWPGCCWPAGRLKGWSLG
jgi:hypothetical protein